MPKTITVRNRNHPHNVMHEVGQQAYAGVRQLSNKDLDQFLADNVTDKEALKFILPQTRSKKLKFLKACAMHNFKQQYKEAVKEANAKKEAEENGTD